MNSDYWNLIRSELGSDCSGNSGGFSGYVENGSLLLDGERGELVKAPMGLGKKGGGKQPAKSAAALKSHSEAEKRRRERINGHLATLRGLVPSNGKMDKAALLAEVVRQVKQLKKTATEAAEGSPIPTDSDEVSVEPLHDGTHSFVASLCCDYRPELFSDLSRTIDALNLDVVRAEISTLGGRAKNVFVFTAREELLAASVHQALSSVLDRISSASEYLSGKTLTLMNKRRRISFCDNS